MKPEYRRADRVSSEIREIVALILTRFSAEPSLGRLTIVHVNLTDDLKVARIFYTVFPGEDPRQYERMLNRYKGLIRKEMGKRLRMKWVPDLAFVTPSETGAGISQYNVPPSGGKDEKMGRTSSSSLMDELENEK